MSNQANKKVPPSSPRGKGKDSRLKQAGNTSASSTNQAERIAKVMARAGVASRRESERMIEAGRVSVNGKNIDSPALNVTLTDVILVNGRPLPERQSTQIWRFHKPRGCVTTDKDPEGRELAFDHLPSDMARVISVGRLDYNTEGLLLLTNDGGLARHLELPATGWLRRYRVRVRGSISQHKLDELKNGITVDGVRYGPIDAQLNRQDKANLWITVSIREGKNREIRRIFESLGMDVSRLIRISYGPFMLGDLASGQIEAIKPKILIEQLGEDIAVQLGIPLDDPDLKKPRRKQRRDEVDSALKSKKPGGNPKGGHSLKFGGKRKTTDRNGRAGDNRNSEEGEKRAKTGRRSRNSARSLEERHLNRAEKRRVREESDHSENQGRRNRGPQRRGGRHSSEDQKQDENNRYARGRKTNARQMQDRTSGSKNRPKSRPKK